MMERFDFLSVEKAAKVESIIDEDYVLRSEVESMLEKERVSHAVWDAVREGRARDPSDIMPLLDMTKVARGPGGELTGLADQLDQLKARKPYLFHDGAPRQAGAEMHPTVQAPDINQAIRMAAGR